MWGFIRLWKRYIDDILGRWRGTERQFNNFVNELNRLAAPFGIQFADAQIGTSVNYLDVQLYLDQEGQVQYSLYRKKMDARQYLNTTSFRPPQVFDSVAFSQMLRVIKRNSQEETCLKDLEDLKADLSRCGHNAEKMGELEPLAVERAVRNVCEAQKKCQEKEKTTNSLVFTTKFFKEVKSLRILIHDMKDDIQRLVGDVRIIFAMKKHEAIRDYVVKNRTLSRGPKQHQTHASSSQSCGSKKCETCPLLFENGEKVMIDGKEVILDMSLNCRDKNVIYVAQCSICENGNSAESTYFGKTTTAVNVRFNGHRNKFKADAIKSYTKSALSQHCFDGHPDSLSLKNFKVGFVKRCSAMQLEREEHRLSSMFRTDILGINRIKVVR